MGQYIELSGRKFGKLTAIRRVAHRGGKAWLCECECGNFNKAITSSLTGGKSTTCGKCRTQFFKKYKKEYQIWWGMKSRCFNKKHRFYKDYGGRGITMSSEWKNDFALFVKEMGERPQGYSIERIDNDGDYSKDNCRWASRREQKNNCRNNRWLTKDGLTLTMAQWARKLGINYRTLKSRLNIQKKSVEEALKPYGKKRQRG